MDPVTSCDMFYLVICIHCDTFFTTFQFDLSRIPWIPKERPIKSPYYQSAPGSTVAVGIYIPSVITVSRKRVQVLIALIVLLTE
jgi:hypothetical protein